jgi:hypothetical protein
MKEETIEEAVERLFKDFLFENPIIPKEDIRPFKLGFIKGTKWQSKKMYSEEEVLEILFKSHNAENTSIVANTIMKWFEQFKKK